MFIRGQVVVDEVKPQIADGLGDAVVEGRVGLHERGQHVEDVVVRDFRHSAKIVRAITSDPRLHALLRAVRLAVVLVERELDVQALLVLARGEVC